MATDRGVKYVHGLAALGYALAGKVPVLSLEMRAKTPFFPHVADTMHACISRVMTFSLLRLEPNAHGCWRKALVRAHWYSS